MQSAMLALGEKKTTKRLELKIGESKRFFQISYVSNADFEMTELDKYTRIMQAAPCRRGTHR